MSSEVENQQTTSHHVPEPRNRPDPPPPPPKKATLPSPSTSTLRRAIPSKYLINDIPPGTTRVNLSNYLIKPLYNRNEEDDEQPVKHQQHVQFSRGISKSKLDGEFLVAVVEFMDTPKWLRCANRDPFGLLKTTPLGPIWRGAAITAKDPQGPTEFMRAVIADNDLYAETLAEFSDTYVNVQDIDGRTALHWACVKGLPNMVMFCLSVPGCNVSLRDMDNLTAFDHALQGQDEVILQASYRDTGEWDYRQSRG